MSYKILITQMCIMFILVVIGIFVGKKKEISQRISRDLSIILLEIATPALVINSMIREFDLTLLTDALLCFVIASVFYVVMFLITIFLAKVLKIDKKHRGVFVLASSISNAGFLGFPLVNAVFGADGLFLAAFINISLNIICYTWGTRLIVQDGDANKERPSLIKTLLSPINIGTLIGLIIFLVREPVYAAIGEMPDWLVIVKNVIRTVISNLSGLVSPLAMFLVGISIGRSSAGKMFRNRDAIISASIRMIFAPLALLFFLKIFNFHADSMVPYVSVFILSMPVASAAQMLSDRYDGDSEFAAHVTFLSNIMCLVTVPLIMSLCNY